MPSRFIWQDNRISGLELAGLTIALIVATAAVTVPLLTGLVARHDAWMAGPISALFGIAVVAVVTALARRFPGDTLPDYAEKLFGKWGGRALTFFFATYFLIVGSIVVRESSDFLIAGFYPNTSAFAIGAMAIALTSFMLWHGLEVAGRVTLIIIPVQMFFTFLVTLAVIPQVQPALMLPLFEHGVAPVLRAAFPPTGWYGEVVALAFLLPLVRGRKAERGALWGIVMAAGVMVVVSLTDVWLFGDEIAQFTYPRTSATRFVTLGGFLRIDPLTMAVWLFLTIVKLALIQYLFTTTFARTAGLADHRPLIIPAGLLMVALGEGLFNSKQALDAWLMSGGPVWAALMSLVIPGLIWLWAVVRGVRGEARGEDG